jgi:polyhydroxyalkanoate synthesis regulator phasin|tara:strand:- start:76 stop:489 length:414 start_codon:yes stop_codon:yes gene_type:complete
MKTETRNKIVENIGLAWVYSPPKARQYLNEALRGFAEDRKEQEDAAKRLLEYVFKDEKPAKGKPVVGGTSTLEPMTKQVLKVLVTRPYPVTLDTILRNTDVKSKMAVHSHISAIRNAGYNVQSITTGRAKRKYKLGA